MRRYRGAHALPKWLLISAVGNPCCVWTHLRAWHLVGWYPSTPWDWTVRAPTPRNGLSWRPSTPALRQAEKTGDHYGSIVSSLDIFCCQQVAQLWSAAAREMLVMGWCGSVKGHSTDGTEWTVAVTTMDRMAEMRWYLLNLVRITFWVQSFLSYRNCCCWPLWYWSGMRWWGWWHMYWVTWWTCDSWTYLGTSYQGLCRLILNFKSTY